MNFVQNSLDSKSTEALALLYAAQDGLPADDLGLDGGTFLALLHEGYLEEPEGEVVKNEFVEFVVHQGFTRITPKGRAYVEAVLAEKQIAQEMTDKAAQEKTEKNRDRRFQLANTLIGAVVGAALTLLVEHFPDIVTFVQGILQNTPAS